MVGSSAGDPQLMGLNRLKPRRNYELDGPPTLGAF